MIVSDVTQLMCEYEKHSGLKCLITTLFHIRIIPNIVTKAECGTWVEM